MEYRLARRTMKILILTLTFCAGFFLVYLSVFAIIDTTESNILFNYVPSKIFRSTFKTSAEVQWSQDWSTNNNATPICRPRESVVFLKTHKCASSTVQNILMRFGDLRNLTLVLPAHGNYLGHPAKFTPNLTLPLPSLFSHQFSIFCHHTRWHGEYVKQIMPSDAVYISIIKEPAAMFESLYNWVNLDIRYSATLENFAENPGKSYYNSSEKLFARNPMLFDFGLEMDDFDNWTKIEEKIHEINQTFSLIMLADFMDESLVLLRDLMCWDWTDIIVFRVNARQDQYKQKLSADLQDKIRRWNSADHALYTFFRKRFQGQVEQYGVLKMKNDVELLRDMTKEWYNFCVQHEIPKTDTQDVRFQVWHPSVSGFQLTKTGLRSPICIRLAMAENPYTDFLRSKLWPHMVSQLVQPPATTAKPAREVEFW